MAGREPSLPLRTNYSVPSTPTRCVTGESIQDPIRLQTPSCLRRHPTPPPGLYVSPHSQSSSCNAFSHATHAPLSPCIPMALTVITQHVSHDNEPGSRHACAFQTRVTVGIRPTKYSVRNQIEDE